MFPPQFAGIIDGFNPLATLGGAVSVPDADETNLTVAPGAAARSFLMRLEAICTVVSTTGGVWTLRDAVGGATLLVLSQPETVAALGTRYVWEFPHPWPADTANAQFTIQGSVATIGTWLFIANGYNAGV